MKYSLKYLCLLILIFLTAVVEAQFPDWKITKPSWSYQDESNFGEFVARIGYAVEKRSCGKVSSCLRSSANPYSYSDPSGLNYFADCADLPYLLRSYFAWKNGLPMSVQSGVAPRNVAGNGGDIRYTPFGNRVTGRYDADFIYSNANSILRTIVNVTSSASYRMMGLEDQGLFSDYYPVKIDREGIHSGTVLYDPNGHVALIYKVTDDGRAFYIDAHPDNSLTSGMFSRKFVRSNPYQGAGFKNFRPLAVSGEWSDNNGNLYYGKIVGAKNNQLSSLSLEQFYGNAANPPANWENSQFIFEGKIVSYYEYVRVKLAKGHLKIDPILDMKENVHDICSGLQDRIAAVKAAVDSGIQNNEHPYRLPYNIYGTDGDWENYASPSRDARLKISYMELLSESQNIIKRYNDDDPAVIYNGTNLPADLLKTYQTESQSCQISYVNSDGRKVNLNLEDVRKRLFDLSFDPYHCVELRWGAKSPQELASCSDNENKLSWFRQERWLRYQYERRYDARMDYSLAELNGPKPGAGIAQPPNVDIVGYLSSQK
jgi:hypothetical protein